MAEMMDSEREAFEAWAAERSWPLIRINDDIPGAAKYEDCFVSCSWLAWQAAHITQPAQAVDVVAIREVIEDLREWGTTDKQLAARAEWLTRAIGNAQAEG